MTGLCSNLTEKRNESLEFSWAKLSIWSMGWLWFLQNPQQMDMFPIPELLRLFTKWWFAISIHTHKHTINYEQFPLSTNSGSTFGDPTISHHLRAAESGFSDTESMPCSMSHFARSGWSEGPWPQMPTYLSWWTVHELRSEFFGAGSEKPSGKIHVT